jgi:tetratricopeptide (TPR) repeat protein
MSDVIERVMDALRAYADGVHQLGEPAAAMDADLPEGVRAVWQAMDGAELFHGELVLYPRAAWTREAGKLHVGEMGEDGLWVALDGGAVWRLEESTGEWIEEGSSADRWLSGWVDAEALLYDREGEFNEGAIDEEGELTPETEIARARALLKRDRRAAAPRWRLARALVRGGKVKAAREELEELVAQHPRFAWAWYDLARASEALGELAGAREEAVAAAEADSAYEHAGFFLAWAARLAMLAADEPARVALAARALAADGRLAERQLDGARASLEAGEVSGARELCEVALALAPRDLAALDLVRQIEAAGGKKR